MLSLKCVLFTADTVLVSREHDAAWEACLCWLDVGKTKFGLCFVNVNIGLILVCKKSSVSLLTVIGWLITGLGRLDGCLLAVYRVSVKLQPAGHLIGSHLCSTIVDQKRWGHMCELQVFDRPLEILSREYMGGIRCSEC